MVASTLLPNPKNWRSHPAKQRDALQGILAEVGYAGALLVRETDGGDLMLIDGHLRAETTPDTEVPVLVLDVTEAEADKLLATIDPLSAMAEANGPALIELLGGMTTENDALQKLFDALASDAGLYDPTDIIEDEAPEPPANPVTRLGDLWLLGPHRVMCGDATDEKHVRHLLAGQRPFIMATDPPYGVAYEPDWRLKAGINKPWQDRAEGKVQNDDRVDWSGAYVLFPGHVAYVWHAGRFAAEVAIGLHAAGFQIRAQVIWAKPSLVISRGHYHWQHEPCWYAARKGGSAKWRGDRKQSTVWQIANMHRTQGSVDDGKTQHGTQKPVECMARPIRHHGGADDDVYDPFVGSGTTLIAAEQLERRCFAMEIDPAYCDVTVERWERFTGRKAKRRKASGRAV